VKGRLPLLVSVPHAGLRVAAEVASYCVLSPREIERDGDEGAAAIYDIATEVAGYVTTDVARAIVDVNRAEDDRRPDGAVKTHTCWDVEVYRPFPPPALVRELIVRHHRPYHERLTAMAGAGHLLGVDCHTMAAEGPPVGPDPGQPRPRICLSNADGTCPRSWIESLAACFERVFDTPVAINRPFRGGYIVRRHAPELPWVQLELSRAPFATDAEKRTRLLRALDAWCSGGRRGRT
jgi:N-formylglutamate amidohydrolase